MGNFFSNMGGTLKTGWNLLTEAIKAPIGPGITFFPAPQKKIITGAEVSKTPAAPIVGYRPQQKDAVTLGTTFQGWWGRTFEAGRRLWDGVRTSFMGYGMKDLGKSIGQTAGEIVKQTGQAAIKTLPNYFMQKWGLVPREDTGEQLGNTPVVPHYTILYPNETQTNAPVTQGSGIIDFFKNMLSSQPKGTYSIGYPQSEPIPVPYPVPVGQEAVDKGGALNWIWIVIIVIGAIVLVRSVRK